MTHLGFPAPVEPLQHPFGCSAREAAASVHFSAPRPDANVEYGLALFREPDHVHRWGITTPPARSALQRRFKFPYRRVARTPDVLERNAGLGFAAAAFDL